MPKSKQRNPSKWAGYHKTAGNVVNSLYHAGKVARKMYGKWASNTRRASKVAAARGQSKTKTAYKPASYGSKGTRGGDVRIIKFGKSPKTLSKSLNKQIQDALGLTIQLNQQYVNQQQCVSGSINMLPLREFPMISELKTVMGSIPTITGTAINWENATPLLQAHAGFTIRNQIQTTSITNAENANCKFEAYLFQARKDVPNGAINITQIFQNGMGNNGHSALSNVAYGTVNAGLSDQNNSETPFDSYDLCHYFKCIRKETAVLAPGHTKVLTVKQLKERAIRGFTLYQENPIVLKGSMFWITRIAGSPADDATTHLVVGTTGAKIDIIQTMSAEIHSVGGKNAVALGNQAGQSLAITAPTFINPAADVNVADASA